MIAKAFIIVSFCVAASLQLEKITPCNNNEPVPGHLNVVDCDKEPCELYKGYYVNAYWDFTTVDYTTSLKLEAQATLFEFITVPYSFNETNSISTLAYGETLPLQAFETKTYRLTMPVTKAALSNMQIDVKLSLSDNNNNVLSCFKIRAKILDSPYHE